MTAVLNVNAPSSAAPNAAAPNAAVPSVVGRRAAGPSVVPDVAPGAAPEVVPDAVSDTVSGPLPDLPPDAGFDGLDAVSVPKQAPEPEPAPEPGRDSKPTPGLAALLDLDGTLVDTNYHHAIAWFRAFREHGIVLPVWRLHRHIGMGGDQLVAAVAGERAEREHGDAVRAAHARHFHQLIDEVELMADARELVQVLHDRGAAVVLASSSNEEDLEHFRSVLDVDDLLAGVTSSADVERAKPSPDIICAALEKVPDAERAVLIGDSTWDCEAARRAGVASVALLTGGFSEQELREAGAAAVFASIGDLLDHLDRTPLAEK